MKSEIVGAGDTGGVIYGLGDRRRRGDEAQGTGKLRA